MTHLLCAVYTCKKVNFTIGVHDKENEGFRHQCL